MWQAEKVGRRGRQGGREGGEGGSGNGMRHTTMAKPRPSRRHPSESFEKPSFARIPVPPKPRRFCVLLTQST